MLCSRRVFLLFALCSTAAADEPPYVLQWPAGTGDIFIADTSENSFYRYSRKPDGSVVISESYMSIGSRGAGKRRDRDRRTPLGVYFVVDQLDTGPMDPMYGITAFPLDYPNERDRQRGRTGDGIWIHGVPPGGGRRPPRDTDGCIALPNEQLRSLIPVMRTRHTPVLIATDNADGLSGGERRLIAEELRAALEGWHRSLSEARLDLWLEYYDTEFEYRGLSREEWAVLALDSSADTSAMRQLRLEDVFIARDPEDEAIYLTRFQLGSASGTSFGFKRLYWRRDDAGRFRIVAEDSA